MNNKLNRLKDIKVENYIWVIYIVIIFFSWIANSKEKDYIITNNFKSKQDYQTIMILIFSILIIIYLYFTLDSYEDVKKLNIYDSTKKVILTNASLTGSTLILISGIIFLLIAIFDDNIDTELAFN